jgi:hypothetical protein
VSALCTSFPFDLRRIARSRAARALVCVLALVLAATNVMAAAMPVHDAAATAAKDASASASHASRAHCAGDEAPASRVSRAVHPGHGADCPCCGKACACMHACDGLVLAMPAALSVPTLRTFAAPSYRGGAAIEAPLLRPPIA